MDAKIETKFQLWICQLFFKYSHFYKYSDTRLIYIYKNKNCNKLLQSTYDKHNNLHYFYIMLK